MPEPRSEREPVAVPEREAEPEVEPEPHCLTQSRARPEPRSNGGPPLVVGLTGGIGSGKSTVGSMLHALGARWVDADRLAREALAPGTAGAEAVRRRFGGAFFDADGKLDRAALAGEVFADDESRRDLEAIVHPVVRAGLADAVLEARGTGAVVVLEIPLLDPTSPPVGLDAVLVVDVPEELAVERLVAERHLPREDALARVRAQRPLAERRAQAGLGAAGASGAGSRAGAVCATSYVLENSGDRADLERSVAVAWTWLRRLLVEKAERAERAEQAERVEQAEQAGTARGTGKAEKAARTDRADQSERANQSKRADQAGSAADAARPAAPYSPPAPS